MKKFILAMVIASVGSVAFGQIRAEWGPGTTPITIYTTEPLDTRGIEFKSTGAYLEQGESAAPYAFFLTNGGAPGAGLNQITAGALANVPLNCPDGCELSGFIVSAEATSDEDITATWGKGTNPTAFPVRWVPEPAAGLMAALGLFGLLGLRRRR